MQPCRPLVPDAGNHADQALTADTINRDRHTECQAAHQGLVKYVRVLIAHGVIGPIRQAAAQGASALTATNPRAH